MSTPNSPLSFPTPNQQPSEMSAGSWVGRVRRTDVRLRWLVRPLAAAAALMLVFQVGVLVGMHQPHSTEVAVADQQTPDDERPDVDEVGGRSVADVVSQTRDAVAWVVTPGRTGTGFFISPGRMVTAYHVVAVNAVEDNPVDVVLADGRNRTGRVVHADPRMDVAVVAMDEPVEDVDPLPLADLSDVQVGEQVVSIGAPLSMQQTVTTGVVSSLSHSGMFAADPVQSNLLQTDAAINPGSSGGPLVDMDGQVVGVVVLRPDVDADSRPIDGVALAVRADTLQQLLDQWAAFGDVQYPYLGIQVGNATSDDGQVGARVDAVLEDSGADAAGLLPEDVIVEFAGREILRATDLTAALLDHRPGDTVPMQVWRDGEMLQVDVTLQQRPAGS